MLQGCRMFASVGLSFRAGSQSDKRKGEGGLSAKQQPQSKISMFREGARGFSLTGEGVQSAKMPMEGEAREAKQPNGEVEKIVISPSDDAPLDLHKLVEELWIADRCTQSTVPYTHPVVKGVALPSRDAVFEVMELLLGVFFPGYFGRSDLSEHTMPFYLGSQLDKITQILEEQIKRGLYFTSEQHCRDSLHVCEGYAKRLARHFVRRLPTIRRLLCTDVHAAYIGDPAALSPDEVIFCYPGLLAIAYQRIAHQFYQMRVPILPRMITERAHSMTGIDIHPGATIDEGFFIDHGTGVVIGETAILGKRVRLYQGVTLGAKSFPLDEHGNPIKGIKRHPNLEDDVIVYSGATILGDITIGAGSVIGGNIWLTHSVPPNSRISQSSARTDLFEAGGGI